MIADKLNRLWLLATSILILIILISSLVIWLGRDKDQTIISLNQISDRISPENILVEGAVANPGSYPLRENDTISDLIKTAGGPIQNAELSSIKIVVPQIGDSAAPQKIDINRAEVWLLLALPGIGEVRAQRIIDYRSQNGFFRNIEEIMQVPGLNRATFEKIKELITLSE